MALPASLGFIGFVECLAFNPINPINPMNSLTSSWEGRAMPSYEFECLACHSTFMLALSVRDRGSGNIKCPKCGGAEVRQIVSSFMVKTSKKS